MASRRDEDDHTLTVAGEKVAVSVAEIASVLHVGDVAPAFAAEILVGPAAAVEAQVAIAVDAGRLQFEPLDLGFCGGILEVGAKGLASPETVERSVPREILRHWPQRHSRGELQQPATVRLQSERLGSVLREPVRCEHHAPVCLD